MSAEEKKFLSGCGCYMRFEQKVIHSLDELRKSRPCPISERVCTFSLGLFNSPVLRAICGIFTLSDYLLSFRNAPSTMWNTSAEVMIMAKKGMKHPDVTRGPRNETSPVPQIQGKAKSGKEKANPIIAGTTGAIRKCGTKSRFPRLMESLTQIWQGIIWKTTFLSRICRIYNHQCRA